MSQMTEYHTREDVKTLSNEDLLETIIQAEKAGKWKGAEFDDVRMRHKHHTRIQTMKKILLERLK